MQAHSRPSNFSLKNSIIRRLNYCSLLSYFFRNKKLIKIYRPTKFGQYLCHGTIFYIAFISQSTFFYHSLIMRKNPCILFSFIYQFCKYSSNTCLSKNVSFLFPSQCVTLKISLKFFISNAFK